MSIESLLTTKVIEAVKQCYDADGAYWLDGSYTKVSLAKRRTVSRHSSPYKIRKFLIWTSAVSYTHLDVYKRQI